MWPLCLTTTRLPPRSPTYCGASLGSPAPSISPPGFTPSSKGRSPQLIFWCYFLVPHAPRPPPVLSTPGRKAAGSAESAENSPAQYDHRPLSAGTWLLLQLQPSKCGLRTSSDGITWQFARNADSWVPLRGPLTHNLPFSKIPSLVSPDLDSTFTAFLA